MTSDLKHKKIFLLDCDGVIWRGTDAIEGSVVAVNTLLESKIVYFLTNNSTHAPEDLQQKLATLGIEAPLESCIPVSVVTAEVIKSRFPSKKSVHVIGEDGLKKVLRRMGFKIIDETNARSNIDLVIVGMDRKFNYEKLKIALQALLLDEALFIATNTDPTLPTPSGPIPGAGSMVAALECASKKHPDIIIGKPNKYMFEHVMKREKNASLKDYVMIGDRITTDIMFAKNVGISSVLVKTGAREETNDYQVQPEMIFTNLKEVVDFLVK